MLSVSSIAGVRLRSQQIDPPFAADPADAVRRLGAVQAQDYGQALWALGARMEHGTVAAVERAVAEGSILRTWPMRGTIHFIPAEDAGWMLSLSATRTLGGTGRRLQQLELTHADIDRCADLLAGALSGGQVARSQLVELLEQAGISTRQQRGYHILWQLALRGLLCIGPRQGNEPTFALLEQWAPRQRTLDRDAALAELAGRYIGGHGPATVHDFAWWTGLTVKDAKAGFEAVADRFEQQEHGGKTYWFSADALPSPVPATPAVHLLPGFDEYLLGYKDRSAVLAAEHADRVVPGGNGVFMPMLVVDGQVVGTWKRAVKKRSVDITLKPFTALRDLPGIARNAAACYAAFLGLPLGALTVET